MGARAEGRDPGRGEVVDQPGDEGRLGADDDEIDALPDAEPGDGGVVGDVEVDVPVRGAGVAGSHPQAADTIGLDEGQREGVLAATTADDEDPSRTLRVEGGHDRTPSKRDLELISGTGTG